MAATTDGTFIGTSADTPQTLQLRRANRHCLIAGVAGIGKTVTLQVSSERAAPTAASGVNSV